MESLVVTELKNNTLNDSLFGKVVSLLASQMDRALSRLEAMDINNIAIRMARGFVNRINQNSENTLKANIRNNTGLELNSFIKTERLESALDIIVQQNVALIKSIKDEYKENVNKLLRDNVLNGDRPTNLVTQIKDIGQVTKSRAKFIARDQTSKINADLTQLRSESIGSSTYIWSGSMDERERTTHKAMEGKLCKWSDPTVYSDDDGKTWKKRKGIGGVELHPGRDYNCRCSSLPIVNFS